MSRETLASDQRKPGACMSTTARRTRPRRRRARCTAPRGHAGRFGRVPRVSRRRSGLRWPALALALDEADQIGVDRALERARGADVAVAREHQHRNLLELAAVGELAHDV